MKSIRLTFVLLLMLSAVTISAAAGNKKDALSLEVSGNTTVISEDFEQVYFKIDGNSVDILGLGECRKGIEFNGIKNGSVNGKNASMINIPLVDGSMVIEVNASGSKTVKTGDFETMVSLKEQKQLKESRVTMSKDPGSIKFAFSVQPQTVRFFSLTGPDRLVFDFIGIKGNMVSTKDARSANHPSGFRVVVEKDIPQFFAVTKGSGFEFTVDGRKLFSSFAPVTDNKVVQVPVQTAPVKEEKREERVPSVEKTEITGLAFIGEDPEILKIKAEKQLNVSKKIVDSKIEITIEKAFIVKEKEQVIDASSLNGPVSEIAIFNDKDDVKILAKMKSAKFEIEIEDVSNGKEFVFQNKKEKTQDVAGYSEAQIVRVPQMTTGQYEEDPLKSGGAVKMDEEVVQYTGKKINLDFKEVDILDILRLMSDISKLNIIAGDDVKGNVTVRLVDIPWDEALEVILKSKSLGKERFGNIIRVATIKTMQREKEEELAKKNAQKKLEPVKVRLIPVNYAMAVKLMPQIKELLTDRGTVSTDERTNVLIVKDVEEILDKSEQLVEYLDTQTPQVLIEARIVEATSTAALGLGIEWGTTHTYTDANGHPTGVVFPYNMGVSGAVSVPGPADRTGALGFSFGSVGMINDLNLSLNVMESEGKIKIVSSPKVATLDNTEAMIQQGVSIPITTRGTGGDVTTKYVDATLVLKTTPHITADGSILLSLEINKSEPDWSNANYLGEPSIIKKEAKTEILVKSGDTVVIGGVYTNKTSITKRDVPLLSQIPILGWLFKSEESRVERSELLIFLTPRIMNKVKSSIPLMKNEGE
ncbi:MAG TPA: type IV pilus secretin PilQ [bacterium]|nr:type IV pilus secretin PilQ [bacterium]